LVQLLDEDEVDEPFGEPEPLPLESDEQATRPVKRPRTRTDTIDFMKELLERLCGHGKRGASVERVQRALPDPSTWLGRGRRVDCSFFFSAGVAEQSDE
jgi:hypothetical protein